MVCWTMDHTDFTAPSMSVACLGKDSTLTNCGNHELAPVRMRSRLVSLHSSDASAPSQGR